MPVINQPKFRPVLTAAQISHALTLARANLCDASTDLIKALALYEYKIQNEIINPAYIEAGKESLSESLGFTNPTPEVEMINQAMFTPEALYNAWLRKPSDLNLTQLKMVRTYRYENNKMTDDEQKLFEKEVLGLDMENI